MFGLMSGCTRQITFFLTWTQETGFLPCYLFLGCFEATQLADITAGTHTGGVQ